MKKISVLAVFVVVTFFAANTAFAGILSKSETAVPQDTIKKIEVKAKQAYIAKTMAGIAQSPSSQLRLSASVNGFKIEKVSRDRPAGMAGGYYYIQGETNHEVVALEDVKRGHKVYAKKGEVFFKGHRWFRCEAYENAHGDIVRVTNMQIFDSDPSK